MSSRLRSSSSWMHSSPTLRHSAKRSSRVRLLTARRRRERDGAKGRGEEGSAADGDAFWSERSFFFPRARGAPRGRTPYRWAARRRRRRRARSPPPSSPPRRSSSRSPRRRPRPSSSARVTCDRRRERRCGKWARRSRAAAAKSRRPGRRPHDARSPTRVPGRARRSFLSNRSVSIDRSETRPGATDRRRAIGSRFLFHFSFAPLRNEMFNTDELSATFCMFGSRPRFCVGTCRQVPRGAGALPTDRRRGRGIASPPRLRSTRRAR